MLLSKLKGGSGSKTILLILINLRANYNKLLLIIYYNLSRFKLI